MDNEERHNDNPKSLNLSSLGALTVAVSAMQLIKTFSGSSVVQERPWSEIICELGFQVQITLRSVVSFVSNSLSKGAGPPLTCIQQGDFQFSIQIHCSGYSLANNPSANNRQGVTSSPQLTD